MSTSTYRRFIISVTVILASMMQLIDTSIVNVALPDIMGNVGATLTQAEWIVTAYVFGTIIIVPLTGWLAEFFGRKKYYLFSIFTFVLASAFCGQATNIWELVFFRFVQGIAGGGLLPTSRVILIENFPSNKLAMANALFGMGVVIGPTVGPTLGGWLTTSYSWRWIFYINIPVGIISFILAFINVEDVKAKISKITSVDWWGIVFLILGFGSLQIVLQQGERDNWFASDFITWMAVISVIGVILFVWRELTAEDPVVDLRVLKVGNVAIGSIFGFIMGLGLYASVFVFPLFLQNLLGYSAFQTGLILLPSALTAGLMMPVVGTLLDKGASARLTAAAGFVLFFIFSWMMSSQNLGSGGGDFIFPLILRGIGLGCLSVPVNTIAFMGLEGHNLGEATGFISLTKKLGGSFGIASISTFLDWRDALHRTRLVNYITRFDDKVRSHLNALVQGFHSSGSSMATAHQQAYKAMEGTLMRQVSMMSYNDIFLAVGVFFLFCIPLLLFTYKAETFKWW